MDIDELTVMSRWSDAPVYRLVGGTQFYFPSDVDGDASCGRVWPVVADGLDSLDSVTQWIGPLSTRVRALGSDVSRLREEMGNARRERPDLDAINLRVFSEPYPPRQKLTLALPCPSDRFPWGQLMVGDRPSPFRDKPEAVVERVLRDASILRPHAGMAGFSLMSEPWMEAHHVVSALPYLEKYPGLNLPYRLAWGAAGAGIPGVDWLTVLGESPIELLGGVDYMRARLDRAARRLNAEAPQVIEYDGGVIIRAGATPQLSDPATGRAPIGYRVVDAALRPIRWDGRSSRPSALLNVGRVKGLDSATVTQRWAARFT